MGQRRDDRWYFIIWSAFLTSILQRNNEFERTLSLSGDAKETNWEMKAMRMTATKLLLNGYCLLSTALSSLHASPHPILLTATWVWYPYSYWQVNGEAEVDMACPSHTHSKFLKKNVTTKSWHQTSPTRESWNQSDHPQMPHISEWARNRTLISWIFNFFNFTIYHIQAWNSKHI